MIKILFVKFDKTSFNQKILEIHLNLSEIKFDFSNSN